MSLVSAENHLAIMVVLAGGLGYALGTFVGTLIFKTWGAIR